MGPIIACFALGGLLALEMGAMIAWDIYMGKKQTMAERREEAAKLRNQRRGK